MKKRVTRMNRLKQQRLYAAILSEDKKHKPAEPRTSTLPDVQPNS